MTGQRNSPRPHPVKSAARRNVVQAAARQAQFPAQNIAPSDNSGQDDPAEYAPIQHSTPQRIPPALPGRLSEIRPSPVIRNSALFSNGSATHRTGAVYLSENRQSICPALQCCLLTSGAGTHRKPSTGKSQCQGEKQRPAPFRSLLYHRNPIPKRTCFGDSCFSGRLYCGISKNKPAALLRELCPAAQCPARLFRPCHPVQSQDFPERPSNNRRLTSSDFTRHDSLLP